MTKPYEDAPESSGLQHVDELILAYRGASALMTAVSLGLFDAFADSPLDAPSVARKIGCDARATAILLDSLAALGLIIKSGHRYSYSDTTGELLTTGGARSIADNLRYQQLLAEAWAHLPDVVRSGRPHVKLMDLLAGDPAFVERFIEGMADISRRPAAELVRKMKIEKPSLALDVGGGCGIYAQALCERWLGLRVELLDVESTLRIARKHMAAAPCRDRVELRTADYNQTEFGVGAYDLVLFSHVLHDESEDSCQALLGKAARALRSGGHVVIHDFMPTPDGTAPLFHALFSLHMLVYTEKGRAYRADEYAGWLARHGLRVTDRIDICTDRVNSTTALVALKA